MVVELDQLHLVGNAEELLKDIANLKLGEDRLPVY